MCAIREGQVHAKANKLAMAKEYGLNNSEFEFIITVYYAEGALTVKDLSERLMLCSQAVTKIAKNLQQMGYIQTRKMQHDRRMTWIQLTERGSAVGQRDEASNEDQLRRALAAAPNLELEELEGFLKELMVASKVASR